MKYHLRRVDKEITDERIHKKILKSAKHVTLALSMNNQPYLVSLSHGYDEDHNRIYFHCAKEGKKLDYLRSNNVVWGQALLDQGYFEGECNHMFASVHFSGKATFVTDPDQKLAAIIYMIRQLNSNPEHFLSKFKSEKLKDTVIVGIDIDCMSGKKSKEAIV